MATHYEILDVKPSASYEKIRQSYYDAARAWHPDRFVDAAQEEAQGAAQAMRAANEAWRVLGDENLRRTYDRGLGGRALSEGSLPSEGVRVDEGVIRIDPRLLDPSFLDRHRQNQLEEMASTHSAFLRLIPILGFIGLLVGIIVFTAYARGNSSELPTRDTVPNPPIAIPANACVRIIEGPELLEADCRRPNDGRLIGQVLGDGDCRSLEDGIFTVREVPLGNGVTACLGMSAG